MLTGEVLLGLQAGLDKPWSVVVAAMGPEGCKLGLTLSSAVYWLPYCRQIP